VLDWFLVLCLVFDGLFIVGGFVFLAGVILGFFK